MFICIPEYWTPFDTIHLNLLPVLFIVSFLLCSDMTTIAVGLISSTDASRWVTRYRCELSSLHRYLSPRAAPSTTTPSRQPLTTVPDPQGASFWLWDSSSTRRHTRRTYGLLVCIVSFTQHISFVLFSRNTIIYTYYIFPKNTSRSVQLRLSY